MDREKVMALVVSLLDHADPHRQPALPARQPSYGLTTLRNRHVRVKGSTIRFQFAASAASNTTSPCNDRRLASLLKRCMELPGQALFQYLDEDGQRHSIGSSEVNQFLQQLTGADFTAKDYRTWAGSSLALEPAKATGLGAGQRSQTPGRRDSPPGRQPPGQYAGRVQALLYPPGGA
jgi:DNA topoisomerase-1